MHFAPEVYFGTQMVEVKAVTLAGEGLNFNMSDHISDRNHVIPLLSL